VQKRLPDDACWLGAGYVIPAAADTTDCVGQVVGTAPLPEELPAPEAVDVPGDVAAPLDDAEGDAEPHAVRNTPHKIESPTVTLTWRVDVVRDISPLEKASRHHADPRDCDTRRYPICRAHLRPTVLGCSRALTKAIDSRSFSSNDASVRSRSGAGWRPSRGGAVSSR
jgi:hypothetical protein